MPRYTIDVGDAFDAIITELAKKESVTKAEIIRRSVRTYGQLLEQVSIPDRKVSITDKDDKVIKDVIIL